MSRLHVLCTILRWLEYENLLHCTCLEKPVPHLSSYAFYCYVSAAFFRDTSCLRVRASPGCEPQSVEPLMNSAQLLEGVWQAMRSQIYRDLQGIVDDMDHSQDFTTVDMAEGDTTPFRHASTTQTACCSHCQPRACHPQRCKQRSFGI